MLCNGTTMKLQIFLFKALIFSLSKYIPAKMFVNWLPECRFMREIDRRVWQQRAVDAEKDIAMLRSRLEALESESLVDKMTISTLQEHKQGLQKDKQDLQKDKQDLQAQVQTLRKLRTQRYNPMK